MGFASIDDFVNEFTNNGKFYRQTFQKTSSNTATSAAGRVHSTFTFSGIPGAGSYSGTAGVATAMTSNTAGSLLIPSSSSVAPDTRHLTSVSAYTPSTTVAPATLLLCDLLLYYPSVVVTGTPTTLNNTVTLPRYTDGKGVMCFVEVQTLHGAAAPALTLNYRDQNDSDFTAAAMTSPVNSATISTLYQNNGGFFLPLNPASTGVKRINSYTLASGTTGTAAFVLCKPLAEIPLLAANLASERDFLAQIPSLPEIEDGACLSWIILIGAAMTTAQTIMGKVEYGWG